MKFTAHREQMVAILEHAENVVEKRNTIPILSNVLLSVEDGSLTIVATDLTMTIEEKISDIQIETPGKTTINSSTFAALLRKMPALALVSMEVSNGKMSITSGRIRYNLPVLSADDFPQMKPMDCEPEEISIADLSRALKKVRGSISSEETRYYLNGVYLTVVDGKMFAVSTDGHRLSLSHVVDIDMPAPNVIVPKKIVYELIKLLPSYEGNLSLKINETRVEIQIGDIIVGSKLIDGTFPDYTRVIPDEGQTKIFVDADTLAEAIDRVSVITTEKTSSVTFAVEKDGILVTAKSPETGKAEERIEAKCNEEITVAYNGKYLKEVLSSYSGETVMISMANSSAPALIFDPNAPLDRNVLMPMRI